MQAQLRRFSDADALEDGQESGIESLLNRLCLKSIKIDARCNFLLQQLHIIIMIKLMLISFSLIDQPRFVLVNDPEFYVS